MKSRAIGKKLPPPHARQHTSGMVVPIADSANMDLGRHFVFCSPSMRHVYTLAMQVAGSDASVLIFGESGTGKELFARLIHQLSGRDTHPFVPINCGVLQGELFADKFFGHEMGAFTGASRSRRGAFEAAGTGSLFLDEVGEIPPANQADFLRVLEERSFRRVGGEHDLPFQARIIAATNRPLMQMVQEGAFRADLFYRLNVVPVSLPPLRTRKEDIPLLAEHILALFRHRYHRPDLVLHDEVLTLFQEYHWPGNVRELRNLLERLALLAKEPLIGLEHIPADITATNSPPKNALAHAEAPPPASLRLDDAVREAEIRAILRAFTHAGRHKGKTAHILGVSPRTLRYKLAEYNLDI